MGFRHEAVIYGNADDFLTGVMPFIRGALEAGESVLVAVSRAKAALLEGELGAAADEVRFADMETLGGNPARIIPFWRDFLDEHGGRAVRGVGEPVWPGRTSAEIDECRRHESLLNVAFSPAPAWSLLCPYDGGELADDVLAAVGHSHRTVESVGVPELRMADFEVEPDCFAGELSGHPADARAFEFNHGLLAEVRRRVQHAAGQAGLGRRDTADLVTAASELAANSVAHGGGAGTMRAWREPERLVLEFEDRGTIAESLVGRLRPRPAQHGGRGLWLANQLCDSVQIRSSPAGTMVRLSYACAS